LDAQEQLHYLDPRDSEFTFDNTISENKAGIMMKWQMHQRRGGYKIPVLQAQLSVLEGYQINNLEQPDQGLSSNS
jgi:hypothetical protein